MCAPEITTSAPETAVEPRPRGRKVSMKEKIEQSQRKKNKKEEGHFFTGMILTPWFLNE